MTNKQTAITEAMVEAGLREDIEPCPPGTPLNHDAMRRNRIERIYTAMRKEATSDLLHDIAVMMSEFVDNWPQPKKVSTALALIAKTMRAALDGTHNARPLPDEEAVDKCSVCGGTTLISNGPCSLECATMPAPVSGDVVEQIVKLARDEADACRHAQANAANGTDKLYRMGQKDALLMFADSLPAALKAIGEKQG